ncbi:uncharacterized protein LOC100882786 isoform X1 [Megachile rotundata]|uniref:uncharacterized protein LOC100882786 isoform X1 n=1 Tax=Megachile rotundata TaxID=143995 RepID=UPI003FD42B44
MMKMNCFCGGKNAHLVGKYDAIVNQFIEIMVPVPGFDPLLASGSHSQTVDVFPTYTSEFKKIVHLRDIGCGDGYVEDDSHLLMVRLESEEEDGDFYSREDLEDLYLERFRRSNPECEDLPDACLFVVGGEWGSATNERAFRVTKARVRDCCVQSSSDGRVVQSLLSRPVVSSVGAVVPKSKVVNCCKKRGNKFFIKIYKIFERIITNRLEAHLSGDGPDVADCQFGFRRGRSTVDAVQRVRRIAESATSRSGVAIGISLDIVNAFNTLPHRVIEEGLERLRVPPVIAGIIEDYLRERCAIASISPVRRDRGK